MKLKYLIIPIVLYYACFLLHGSYLRSDSAHYFLLGRSLAAGAGYAEGYLPETAPARASFPPGYPFILSIAMKIFGENVIFLRFLTLVISALSLLVLGGILNKYLSLKEAAAVFLLFALSPLTVKFSSIILSESSYILFSWIAIYIFLDGAKALSAPKLLLGAAAVILAFYTRTVGFILFLSLLAYLLARKRYAHAALFGLTGMLMIPWLGYLLSGADGYVHVFSLKDPYYFSPGTIGALDIPSRFLSNIKYYSCKVVSDTVFFPYFEEVTFGSPFFPLKIFLSLVFSALFIFGFYSSARKKIGVIELYVIFYVVSLMFWTYHDARFLLPVYPFLLGYLMAALRALRANTARIAVVAALSLALISANITMAMSLAGKEDSLESSFFEVVAWLKENTPSGSVIMSNDPAAIYLYSQRKGVPFTPEPDARRSFLRIKEYKAGYILAERDNGLKIRGRCISMSEGFLRPLSEKYPCSVHLAYESILEPRICIYKTDITGN